MGKISTCANRTAGRSNNFLNTQEDIDWLLETHLKANEDFNWIKQNLKSFILIGNEDSPTLIECYSSIDLEISDKPFFAQHNSGENDDSLQK